MTAAQLSSFALIMKGRADDRRLFDRGIKLNVMALQNSINFDAVGLTEQINLSEYGLQLNDLTELKELFKNATTFGSLIQAPKSTTANLAKIKTLFNGNFNDLFTNNTLSRWAQIAQQAEFLAQKYDAVVANPPYIGNSYQSPKLKYLKANYKDYEKDIFSSFIDRSLALTTKNDDFTMIPGSPISYWIGDDMRNAFITGNSLHDIARPRQGLATSDNPQFLRYWHEVDLNKIGFFDSSETAKQSKKWFPYDKEVSTENGLETTSS